MLKAKELLKLGRRDEVWEKYCGFIDLRLGQFMQIQRDLLMEQIQLLAGCELGRKLLGSKIPENLEDFRQLVPFTTYEDYAPYLPEKRSDVLPSGIIAWVRTSGRSKGGRFKWVPYSSRMYKRNGEALVTGLIVSSCAQKGEVYLEPGECLIMMTAPPPYATALYTRAADEEMDIRFLPPLDVGEKMEFRDRMTLGFELAMQMGLNYFYGLSSVLAKLGERFQSSGGGGRISLKMVRPSVLLRVARGMITAKLNKRGMLPKDIWKVKGILTGGTDTEIYRDRIHQYWGRKPIEAYGCTEGGSIAFQTWNFKGMTFFPDLNFLEFIPFEDHIKLKEDPSYQPRTLFFDELQLGIYELVLTNLLGGIFTRYRLGDLIEVIALRDDEMDIDTPQMRFYSRADDLIDLAGFVRFTERDIWHAIETTGIMYEDWCARKEERGGEPLLHVYIEPQTSDDLNLDEVRGTLSQGLREANREFADLEEMLGGEYVKVSMLPEGAFARYMREQQAAGADLAHVKPPHMKPSEIALQRLAQPMEA
ncbi:MAG: GH3 auxin-responsive promoter [Anaerolineales bacterium]|nr:GH3 auxin-responsive promoter [Anaerolineales bacterium]